jgi:hypothetical protein
MKKLIIIFLAFLTLSSVNAQQTNDYYINLANQNPNLNAEQKGKLVNFFSSLQFTKFLQSELCLKFDLADCQLANVVDIMAKENMNKQITSFDLVKGSRMQLNICFIKFNYLYDIVDNVKDNYLIQLGDYSNYNPQNNGGTVDAYDITSSPIKISTHDFNSQQTVHVNELGISEQAKNEFKALFSIQSKAEAMKNHFCDKNNNGDVTYTECRNCMYDACRSNPRCWELCTWSIPAIRQCDASITISCAWLAIWN